MTDPLLLDFPDHFETERLIVRAPRAGDGAAGNAAIRASVAELRPWMPWVDPVPTVEETEAVYRRGAAHWLARESLPVVLIRRQDGAFVGGAGLERIDWSVPRVEIGYWCRTSLTGQGYITEAVRGLTTFAFDWLHAERIEIRCDTRNTRSAAVAERAGYTLEARFQHHLRDPQGHLRDALQYVKFREG